MGSVKFETRNEGRGQHEWDYVPLSEPRVVAMLITKRSQLDAAYHPKQESVSLACAGIFPFSEPVLATYIDLDRLIATCGLSNPQRRFVDMLMDGHTLSDIATLLGLTVQSVGMQYRRAIAKIVQRNNERWDSAYVVR